MYLKYEIEDKTKQKNVNNTASEHPYDILNKSSISNSLVKVGRSILKPNLERAVEIPEHIYLVQNFAAVLIAQRQVLSPNVLEMFKY